MRLLGTFVIVFSLLVSCQNLPTHHPFPEEETLQQLLKKQTDTIDYTLDGELTEKAVKRLDEEVKRALQQRDTAFFVRLINQWRAENFFKARISLPFEQRKQIFYEYSAKDSTHLMYYFYTMGSYYAIGHQVDSMQHYYQLACCGHKKSRFVGL